MRRSGPAAVVSTLLWLGVAPAATAQVQVSNQSFEVTPEVARATVGDSVTLRFRVRLDERDLLFDTIPQPVSELPPGIRLLSVEKMTRTPDRIFHGTARLVFYRTGRRPVPVFGLPFMRAVKGLGRGMLTSDSAFVEIVPLLPAGNPSLKDIKELEPSRGPGLVPVVLAAIAALLVGMLALRARRRRAPALAAPAPAPGPTSAPPSTPYDRALTQLEAIERARWPARGEIARHYEAVIDVVREYLEAAEGVAAREQTSSELVWALPPHLTESDGRAQVSDLLQEADLVKFAKYRPSPPAADDFLERARGLLARWHAAAPVAGEDLAVR
jgi:hypothetical protein